MILHIASGECCADDLRRKLPNAEILPFNEAMCEGETCLPVFGERFCALRATAYGVPQAEYERKSPRKTLRNVGGYSSLELYFDYDMFCAVNCLTLLAYLDQQGYAGDIFFNLVRQDGSADVISRSEISARGALSAYKSILLRREPVKTGIPALDATLPLYFEYKRENNEIVRYALERLGKDRNELIRDMLVRFVDYGLSDSAAEKFIAEAARATEK